ncbi:hypothetical protein H5410_003109 [Solanum commersonii]|uniref:Uncharacterized protein n=1 Tax=Solanum commersonii TaxID=4109 RepID=A0A9J6B446_SOLCO|nr:hypothetical protein H5410_003109 [Solanum commersonii]
MRIMITVTSMIHPNKTRCYDFRMDPPWITKGRGRGNSTRGRGRSSPGSSYRSSSNSPIIQSRRMSLINSKISQSEASSSDTSRRYPVIRTFQNDTFASIAKEENDEIKSYEKALKKEMIFHLENFEIQRKEEPWKIFQRYLINGLYFSGYNTSENDYNLSKMIIKQIISVEDWGISIMKERQISLNKIAMSFTYWDYIKTFDKVKISPDLNELYNTDPICYPEKIDQIYFFIEFSIPWIHQWTPEVGFTEEQIPFLYRTFYNNFWDKLMKKDPKTKTLYGQKLLDLITKRIQEYGITTKKGVIADNSVRHISRKIFVQDGDKEAMINNYLEKAREKSDTFMRSETSEDATDDIQEAQSIIEVTTSEDTLRKAEDFLQKLKEEKL